MKAKIIAMFLAVVMVLSLGGCASSKGTPAPEVEPAQEDEVSRFTADELEGFWSSGSLTKEEIGTMFSAGEISSEVYEEFLSRMSEDVEFNAPEDESSERLEDSESPATSIDTSTLLTTHMIEFEDADGYQIRETIQISPIFREDDLEMAHALWGAPGNDVADFPSKEALCEASHQLEYIRSVDNYDMLEYIIGTFEVENLTNGFSITPDNPRGYIGILEADGGNDNTATLFNADSVSAVIYSSGIKCYGDGFITPVGDAKMKSDTWGPCAFVVALPNKYTPNQPDGYRYDEIEITFGNKGYGDSGYDVFRLAYYK